MKTLQNNFTTPEQSKRLLELGVPMDSADCYWNDICQKPIPMQEGILYSDKRNQFTKANVPVWSVGRLIEIICNCHIITNQLAENWICCDKDTNLIELLITDIEIYTNVQHMNFSKLED